MLAIDLYQTLNNEGVQLWAEGDKLRFAPKEKITPFLLAELKANKNELITLLATKPHPPMEDGQHSPTVEATHLEFKERYAHMVKCQQCEHLTTTGYCRVKPQIKPIPDALRTCDKFSLLKGERGLIQGQNYTASEINSLVERYEKPLFYHALDCSICHIQKARYCANGYAIGSVYDALLLVCEDAQARREDLALRIDRACISGRSVFEAFNPANVPPPPNTERLTPKYGNTPDYEAFINHWTACEVCKPNLGRYCSEGQKLKEVADNSNVAF
ncbi:MAG: hypothetical protein IPG70_15055 [Moraxellaceae bacterium]|nr:hypothetical protein [Moraxellaceae bacterium]